MIFFLAWFHFSAAAGEVTIKGSSTMPGKIVRLLMVKDLISGLDTTLATTTSDFKGSFELSASLTETSLAEIAIGLNRATILLSPGSVYEIALILEGQVSNSYFDAQPHILEIKQTNDGGRNDQLNTINFIFNTFVFKHFTKLQRSGNPKLIDSLKIAIDRAIPLISDPFISSYRDYKLASLSSAAEKMTNKRIFEQFFKGKSVAYTNPEYLSLLQQYFSDHYFSNNKLLHFDGFVEATRAGLKAVRQFISQDTFFGQEERLKELVLLFHLDLAYYNTAFYEGSVKSVLTELAGKAIYPEHRSIAANIIQRKTWLSPGSPFPAISLTNHKSEMVRLGGDGKKLQLLLFVSGNCAVCFKEMEQLASEIQEIGQDLHVIIVANREGFQQTVEFVAKQRLPWQVYNTGNDVLVYERLNIKVFPEYIILYPDNRIAMAPAPPLAGNLLLHLKSLVKKTIVSN